LAARQSRRAPAGGLAPEEVRMVLERGPDLASVRPYLESRTVDARIYSLVRRAYRRCTSSPNQPAPATRDGEIRGALGFWLLTMQMLWYTTRAPFGDGDWERRQRALGRLFDDPAVRRFFARLYHFPHRELDLASARIHRLGTTSFILRCLPIRNDRYGADALKCILYPYLQDEAIAAATEAYYEHYKFECRDADRRRLPPMAQVYESRKEWIRMDFIEGRTLREALQDVQAGGDRRHRLDVGSLRRYGIPLLEALRDVPHPHLDLSPSNIIVVERDGDCETPAVEVVLIDFGQNYLLSRDVGSGSVAAETARHVAPELLRSRGPGQPSGYEDVFSVGHILLDIAHHGESEAGFIRNELYMDAPFLGRLIEDLVDEDPDKRLLLRETRATSLLDAGDRHEIYDELRERLRQGLKVYEQLASVTPTLADRPAGRHAGEAVLGAVGTMLMALSVVSQPVRFYQLGRQGGVLGREYSYLFRWAFLCSLSWAAGWTATFIYLQDNAVWKLVVPSAPDLVELVQTRSPEVLLRHYRAIPSLSLVAWDDLLFRLVLLTVIVTAAKYYMEIFAVLTVRGLPRSAGNRSVEVLMRLTGVVFGPMMIAANAYAPTDWLPLGALAVAPIIVNNLASWALATKIVKRAERAFSTVRQSDLRHAVDLYSEWWKLMLAYGLIMATVGGLVALGWAHDLPEYAIIVMTANVAKLYRSNCCKLAPWARGTLARALANGERQHALDIRAGRSLT
jgi:hypothetical protein